MPTEIRTPRWISGTLTYDEYMNARWVSEPLCLFDCCLETDGALAAVVVGSDRARDCRQPPVYVHARAGLSGSASGMTNYFCADPLRSPSWVCGKQLWRDSDSPARRRQSGADL